MPLPVTAVVHHNGKETSSERWPFALGLSSGDDLNLTDLISRTELGFVIVEECQSPKDPKQGMPNRPKGRIYLSNSDEQ